MLKLRTQIKSFVKAALGMGRRPDASKFPLLQLPPELIYDIADYLELYEVYFLSQTCGALRRLTHGRVEKELRALGIFPEAAPSSGCADCTKSKICPSCIKALEVRKRKAATHSTARFNFWAGISNFIPDRWVCPYCQTLHPINLEDLEAFRLAPHFSCSLQSDLRPHTLARFYAVREAEIQLALKRTRFSDFYQKHLQSLLAPSSQAFGGYPHQRQDEFCAWVYEATPKLVNGRSMLQEKWSIGMLQGMRMTPHSLWFLELCPHMAAVDGGILSGISPRQHGLTAFREHAQYAYRKSDNSPYYDSFGHCSLCLTDFSVSFDGHEAHIAAWYDFGSYDSPTDDAWMAHSRFQDTQERPCREFSHDNGDVRRMFLTGKPYNYERH